MPHDRRRQWAVFLLGFALSGFFDGILLHQVLQWHHLLLGWREGALQDMRVQLAADGFFHLLMYALVLAALALLWRSRTSDGRWSGREAVAVALAGFGAWHVVDGVLSHWLLGIHRVKMDSPNPLFWDVLWIAVFGIVPLAAAAILRRSGTAPGGPSRGRMTVAVLALSAIAAGAWSARPPSRAETVLVVLASARHVNAALDTAAELRGGMLWASPDGHFWVFRVPENAETGRFYGAGALLVTASPAALGCLSYTRRPRG